MGVLSSGSTREGRILNSQPGGKDYCGLVRAKSVLAMVNFFYTERRISNPNTPEGDRSVGLASRNVCGGLFLRGGETRLSEEMLTERAVDPVSGEPRGNDEAQAAHREPGPLRDEPGAAPAEGHHDEGHHHDICADNKQTMASTGKDPRGCRCTQDLNHASQKPSSQMLPDQYMVRNPNENK